MSHHEHIGNVSQTAFSWKCCSFWLFISGLFPLPGLGGQMQPSPQKKSISIIPSSPQACGSDWVSQDDAVGRQNFIPTDHAPLSPQSSVASSGSEQTEEQGSVRNTFQEDGSGMKGQSFFTFPSQRHVQHFGFGESHAQPTAVVIISQNIMWLLFPNFFFLCLFSRCSCMVEESPPT